MSAEERSALGTITRPFGVTILAVLHVLQAIFLFLVGLAVMTLGFLLSRMIFRFPLLLRGLLPVIGGVLIVVALLDLVLAYGLWSGRGWAWILSLVLAALGILFSLISLVFRGGVGGAVTLIIDAIIIYYLTRPNVKAFFGETPPSATPIPPASIQPPPLAGAGTGYCSNCGAQVTSADKFCKYCGKQL